MSVSYVARSAARPALVPRSRRGRRTRSLQAPGPVVAPAGVPGQRFGGRYRADAQARTLAGAQLWQGTDEVLDRAVTIWALPADRAVPVEVITAILAAARLSDARIARIFDADCAVHEPYVISERAPGRCLEYSLADGLPDPWTAAAIALAAASALAAAHEAGRPHLCLTPRSLLWGHSGVKIIGLGLEAALSGTSAADPAKTDARGAAGLLYALLTGYWPGAGVSRLPRAPTHNGMLCSPGQVRAGIPAVLDAITASALGAGSLRAAAGTGRRTGLRRRTGSIGPITTPGELAFELRKVPRPDSFPEQAWHLTPQAPR